jgi:hypothetical protein
MSIFGALRAQLTRKGERIMDLVELFKAEELFYKREFTAAQRRKLASEGKALPDGSYPVETAADLHPAAVLIRSGHGDIEGAQALVARRAKELKVPNPLDDKQATQVKKAELVCALLKSEVQGKFYGVVAVPDLPDSQEDVFSKAEIERMCHGFMRDYALAKADHEPDLQHSGVAADADLVENYIAPAGATLGGKTLVEGSWITGWQVNDPLLKQDIEEGRFDGLSLEGSGFRTPIAA